MAEGWCGPQLSTTVLEQTIIKEEHNTDKTLQLVCAGWGWGENEKENERKEKDDSSWNFLGLNKNNQEFYSVFQRKRKIE